MKNYIVWENVTIYVVWEGHETTELFECDQTNATIKLFTNIFTHTHTHTHTFITKNPQLHCIQSIKIDP